MTKYSADPRCPVDMPAVLQTSLGRPTGIIVVPSFVPNRLCPQVPPRKSSRVSAFTQHSGRATSNLWQFKSLPAIPDAAHSPTHINEDHPASNLLCMGDSLEEGIGLIMTRALRYVETSPWSMTTEVEGTLFCQIPVNLPPRGSRLPQNLTAIRQQLQLIVVQVISNAHSGRARPQ